MYDVQCDSGLRVVTPEWPDAQRSYERFVRAYPERIVSIGVLRGYVDPDNFECRDCILIHAPDLSEIVDVVPLVNGRAP